MTNEVIDNTAHIIRPRFKVNGSIIMFLLSSNVQKKLMFMFSMLPLMTACTMIDSEICAGCQRPLSTKDASKFKHTSLANFMRERFTDRLGRNVGAYNKQTVQDTILLQLLSSRIERPYSDIKKYCQTQDGKLITQQIYYKPPPGLHVSENDIKQAVLYAYQTAEASAPSQITIDNGLDGLHSTYNVDKKSYASSAATDEYLRVKHYADLTNNSFTAKDYRKAVRLGKIGKYVCKKNKRDFWQVSIKPVGTEIDGSYTWINTELTFKEYHPAA